MAAIISSSKTGIIAINSASYFPAPSGTAATGTITVAANSTMVTGVGTNFSKFNVGDWIADIGTYEMHKIKDIPTTNTSTAAGTVTTKSDLLCTVDLPFQNAISGSNLVIIPASACRIAKVLIYAASGAKINNVAVPVGWLPALDHPGVGQYQPVDPFFADGSGGVLTIMYEEQ